MKPKKQKDARENVDIKKHFQTVKTGVNNGVFIYSGPLTVQEFAEKINVSSAQIIKIFFMKGKNFTLNSLLKDEEIGELCLEFNYDFEKRVEINETNVIENINVIDEEAKLKPRPPIITIMGHVDHGKTTLLDYIRKAHVAKGEAGGITQHIGAYQIEFNKQKITFIDTPGHAAFTSMRARGASVTDIVVLVVAADDGIKPQTEEAIDHAKAANVPIIVFINKIDKANTNIEFVQKQLAEKDLICEEWGGNTMVCKGSALTGKGVDKLLDAILALAEINEYKANPNRLALGVVLESNLDRGLGNVATILIKNGCLQKGDFIIIGQAYGRVRIMFDENNKELAIAYPSQPVRITGLSALPEAGEKFVVSVNEKDIKEIAEKIRLHKALIERENATRVINATKDGEKIVNIILKTDVHGSLEAIKQMVETMDTSFGVKPIFIRASVGSINESDVLLAKTTKALIIGFNIKPTRVIHDLANSHHIKILFYDIIYKLQEDIDFILHEKLDPIITEEETGEAVIQQLWHHSAVGTIAGCLVQNGEMNRNDKARVLRNGKVIIKTQISSMKHLKDVVNKLTAGMEGGFTLTNFNDIKVGDIIQTYREVAKKLHA